MKKKSFAGVAVKELISKGYAAVNTVKTGEGEKILRLLGPAGLFAVTCIAGSAPCLEGVYPLCNFTSVCGRGKH